MTAQQPNTPELEVMVGQRPLNATDQKAECLEPAQKVGQAAGQPDHSPLDPGYILIEAIMQLSIRVHLDAGLSKGKLKSEITQAEALQLAPMLMPTIHQLVGEELPEELQDRLFDEMNHRAVRALSEIPQGEYDALAEAIRKRISEGNSTNMDIEAAGTPNSPDGANPATGNQFRLLISSVDGYTTALLVCLKCQNVLMDTGPGDDTNTPEGVRCDHTNRTPLAEYLGVNHTEGLEL